MSFHSPHLLWLLVPVALLLAWELTRHAARVVANWPKIPRAWAGAFDVTLGRHPADTGDRPRVWLWLGLALCVVALARPQWGVIEEQVFDQSREVIIAVDLSRSMLAQDVKPSRLDRSKLLIQSLLDGLKGERVGLVLFAGTAFLQSPLSSDYEVLREFLPALTPDYLPEGGSNYKAMLDTSMQAFGTSAADRYLIVLSDGESTVDDWKSLTPTLKNKGVRVIGLGVGTAQGSFIPDSGGGLVKDERGAVVMSRLNSSTLQELAQVTGGAYTDASAWVDLPALLAKTVEAGQKGEFSEKNTARLVERFQWFLAPGLLLLLISFWSEFPVRPRERSLPLAQGARRKTEGGRVSEAVVSSLVLAIVLPTLGSPLSARAAESAPDPSSTETLAAPLSKTVGRLAEQPALSAKDCAELAQTTLTYGQRLKSAQQQPVESAVRDALQAVDLGAKSDAKAADWPKLRSDLEALLKREDEKKDDQKKDQDKKDQQKQDQQQQQQQQKQDQQQQQSKDQQQQNQQQNQDQQSQQEKEQQQKQNQDAFGDMKEQQDPNKKPAQKPPPPKPGTQKVGGQQDKQPTEQVDPELAMPLQKLDQVRHQDSPAKLQQLMQGKPEKTPASNGKNW